MRSFKRLFSLILTVAMLATLVVPVQAKVSYTDEALKLQAINVFAGRPEDLNLTDPVTRIQGLTFAIRASGKDKEALAMSTSEIDKILSSWVDSSSYDKWVRPYAAYAIREGITIGVSTVEKRLNPQEQISGASFLVFILKSMGYSDANTANNVAANIAIDSKVLSLGQAVEFNKKLSLIRDDAAAILYGAFTTGINKDGTKLINRYIASGATDEQSAIDSGFIEPKFPQLEALSASAQGVNEVKVVFNIELDAISAINKNNYYFAEGVVNNVRLGTDKKSVEISLSSASSQAEYSLTVKTGVKSNDGVALLADKQFKVAIPRIEPVRAYADNLKEIKIDFNGELDPTSATNKDNYTVANYTIANVALRNNNRGVSIILTGNMRNQEEFNVTVKSGVKSVLGINLASDKQFKESAFDSYIPEAISAEQSGPYSFKVRFSEPMKVDKFAFKFNNNTYFGTNSIKSADNGYSIEVTLYSIIYDGLHEIIVSGAEDYANYRIFETKLQFNAAKDENPPVLARVISASPIKVELEFTKDVSFTESKLATINGIYHTNTSNKPNDISIVGNVVTLDFTTNRLPGGTAYLTISKDVFKDSWLNKNSEVKDMAINVVVDRIKPTVKSINAETETTIVIEFSEEIKSGYGKFGLLDSSGKDVTSEYTITPTYGKDKVTLTFNKPLAGKSFNVKIEEIRDSSDNVIDRVVPNVTVADKTPPKVSSGEIYKAKKIIKIIFNEDMNTSDILNLANYQWGGQYLDKTKVVASLQDNKTVIFDFSKEDKISDSNSFFNVGKVRDAAGNQTENFVNTVTLKDMDLIGVRIASVEATAPDKLAVTLSDALVTFEANDFLINGKALGQSIVKIDYSVNSDNKSVITFTLRDELKIAKTDLADTTFIVSTLGNPADIKSVNSMGVKLAAANSVVAVDKIPANFTARFTDNKTILVTFSEAVDYTTLFRNTFSVIDNTVKSVNIPTDGRTMTLYLDKEVSLNAKVTVSQAYPFEDKVGNESKLLSVEVINK